MCLTLINQNLNFTSRSKRESGLGSCIMCSTCIVKALSRRSGVSLLVYCRMFMLFQYYSYMKSYVSFIELNKWKTKVNMKRVCTVTVT